MVRLASSRGALLRLFGLPPKLQCFGPSESGWPLDFFSFPFFFLLLLFLLAVNAFQHCFLGHQSLCFNSDIGRAWGLLLCIWYHLHENRSLIFIFLF